MERQAIEGGGHGIGALTEREKRALRLLLVGHDAKSMARELGLSVHTVNERLREARRKLAVSSSKEAARRLHRAERADPETSGDEGLGEAPPPPGAPSLVPPDDTPPPSRRGRRAIGGTVMIPLFATALLLLATPMPAPQAPDGAGSAPMSPAAADGAAPAPAVAGAAGRAALAWLALVDAGRWPESWAATAASFRAANTVAGWRAASERARVPLGPVLSRTFLDEANTPAPPNGYRTVRFRTDFANRRGAIETLALDGEAGGWKVVGIYID